MSLQQLIPLLTTLALAVALYLLQRYYKPGPRWRFVSVKGEFTREHHLPEVLPVLPSDEQRARQGDFSFEQAIAWMDAFLRSGTSHPLRPEFELAVRKAEFYRRLAEKMGRGRWREVDELAAQLAELDPLDPSASVARGRANRQLGRLVSAVQFYQQALKLQPTHSMALPELASTCRAMRQEHRFDEALARAKKELGETHPLTIESRVQLGELVRVFADPTDAATVAHIPREQYLSNVTARIEDMDVELGSAVALGGSMLSDDMPELAEKVLERCELTFGHPAETLLLRGMILHHDQDLEAATDTLRQALEQSDSAAVHYELGSALLDRAQTAEGPAKTQWTRDAQQHLRLAIERDPDMPHAIHLLAQQEREQGLDAMVNLIQSLARAYPSAWAPWRVLGDAFASEDRHQDALRAYETGLERQKHDALLLPYLGLLMEMGRKSAALAALDSLKNLEKRDAMLRWRAAQIYCDGQRLHDAKVTLRSILIDESAAPHLRQRAKETLQELEEGPQMT